jgi:predicted nucleic acid-binding protein
MSFVLDSSVVMSWLLEDESDPYADRVEDLLYGQRATVPPLWLYEVVNVLLQASRRGRISEDYAQWALSFLVTLPIDIDGGDLWDYSLNINQLARRHDLTAYDAAYLELALRHGIPLATMDKRLMQAAKAEQLFLVREDS